MKKLMLATLAVCASVTALAPSPALARGGCGIGFHRGPYGGCRVNRVHRFYRGYGWWDGHRYWQNRYRWHGGWRYR